MPSRTTSTTSSRRSRNRSITRSSQQAKAFAEKLLRHHAGEFRAVAAVARYECAAGRPESALAIAEAYAQNADPNAGDHLTRSGRVAELLDELARQPKVRGTPAGTGDHRRRGRALRCARRRPAGSHHRHRRGTGARRPGDRWVRADGAARQVRPGARPGRCGAGRGPRRWSLRSAGGHRARLDR